MLTEVKMRLEPLAEQYARLGNEIKKLEAQKKELSETIMTGMTPGEIIEGSDFDLRCYEGKTTVSWSDAKLLEEDIKKLKLELLKRNILVEKQSKPYITAVKRKSE